MIESLTFSVDTSKSQVSTFVPYIGKFKHLKSLDLSFTSIDDDCMLVFGTNCKTLG